MSIYIVRLLDHSGMLHAEMHMEHNSDDEVIDQVGFLDHPHAIEIWDQDRKVAIFPPAKESEG